MFLRLALLLFTFSQGHDEFQMQVLTTSCSQAMHVAAAQEVNSRLLPSLKKLLVGTVECAHVMILLNCILMLI